MPVRLNAMKRMTGRPLVWCMAVLVVLATAVMLWQRSITAVQIAGKAEDRPQLVFACGEVATSELESEFANPSVIAELKDLNAGVSLALTDSSPGRAWVVRQLNEAGIPVTAWILLPKEQGYYLNADDVPEAETRFADFEQWSAANGLHWAGVGLDIEPDVREFTTVGKGHAWRLVWLLTRRLFDGGRVRSTRQAYSALIGKMQAHGYPVQTYQLPFIVDQRKAHSTLLARTLGIVDVRGDLEVLMLYTSFNRAIGSALIWKLGPEAQAIAVGSTSGEGALNWDEFSRDLIVASHFSRVVGVYSLEGCLHQGFLPRLKTMNWGRSVTIPADAVRKVRLLGATIVTMLWIVSHLPYFVVVLLLAIGWMITRRRARRRFSTRSVTLSR